MIIESKIDEKSKNGFSDYKHDVNNIHQETIDKIVNWLKELEFDVDFHKIGEMQDKFIFIKW